ncbi:MAG: hypothetical protein ACRDKV_06340 [Solirubrobacterales bacterium]
MDSVQFGFARTRALVVALGALAISAVGAPAAFAAPPANDNFAAAQDLLSDVTFNVPGTNVDATAEVGEPNHAGASFPVPSGCPTFQASCLTSVWYRWTAPASPRWVFNTCDSDFDTTLAIYTGSSVNALALLRANDDAEDPDNSNGCGPNGEGSVLPVDVIAGTTYHIAVSGYSAGPGTFTLSTDAPPMPAPGNDDFADAVTLSGTDVFDDDSTNLYATGEDGEPNHVNSSFTHPSCATVHEPICQQSVWYEWTAPVDGAVQVDTCNSDLDTVLSVYSGNSVNALSTVVENDDGGCGLGDFARASLVQFTAEEGETYRMAVSGYKGVTGNVVIAVDGTDPPPPPPPPDPKPTTGDPVVTAPAFTPPQPAAFTGTQAKPKKKNKKKSCNRRGKRGKKASGKKKAGKSDAKARQTGGMSASKKKGGRKNGGKKKSGKKKCGNKKSGKKKSGKKKAGKSRGGKTGAEKGRMRPLAG